MKDTSDDIKIVREINRTGIHNLCGITFECGKRPSLIIGSREVVIRIREFI
jgi:hypothetical protein